MVVNGGTWGIVGIFRGRFFSIFLCLLVAAATSGSAETVRYVYDASGRLIRASFGDGSYVGNVIDYYYDEVGNRIRRAEGVSIVSAAPESLDFGAVDEGDLSSVLTILVANEGNIPLALEGFTVAGPQASEFHVLDHSCALPVEPGTACTVNLAMAPASGGDKAATLHILSDDPNHPEITASLSGSGMEWYSLTVAGYGSGGGSVFIYPSESGGPVPLQESFPAGTAVRLSAIPDSGDLFLGWSGPCSGPADCSFVLDTDTDVGATFADPVRADFEAGVLVGAGPLYVTFTDRSAGQPTWWQWDFGDGTPPGYEQAPGHLYEAPGTYSVALSSANQETSDTLVRENLIHVLPWNAGLWSRRIPLLVDYRHVDEDLYDFPVRLHLSGSSGISGADVRTVFQEVGSDYRKLAVSTEDGDPCWTEVEFWDAVNETADLWVRIPRVRAERDTVLWILYDGVGPVNGYIGETGTPAAARVWEAGYEAVYHMSHDPSGSIVPDSTLRHIGAAVELEATNLVEGTIGRGLSFPASNGNNNFVPAPYVSAGNLSLTRDLALEAFLYPEFSCSYRRCAPSSCD